jgi:hypothetical protein
MKLNEKLSQPTYPNPPPISQLYQTKFVFFYIVFLYLFFKIVFLSTVFWMNRGAEPVCYRETQNLRTNTVTMQRLNDILLFIVSYLIALAICTFKYIACSNSIFNKPYFHNAFIDIAIFANI